MVIGDQQTTSFVRDLMKDFAERTGLVGERAPTRYLWTDAFAVCNFLELEQRTGDKTYRALTLRLVDQVHQVLGRHRADDPREGWISGLNEEEGKRHPAKGGLRIGKALGERRPDEPVDERLEWDRDGQYFHYLTKWMHALARVGRVTGDPRYVRWAMELAETAVERFSCGPPSGGQTRMVWKMSIDLSRPLVDAQGQHDPLDGLVTCLELRHLAKVVLGLRAVKHTQELMERIGGFGMANLASNELVSAQETLFRTGSVSKLVTWTAVMQLIEQGKLDLHTDVNQYLDTFQIPATHPAPITLTHLMTHTGGFEDRGFGF